MNNVRIERALARAGVYAAVEERDGRLFVTGQIGSEEERRAVAQILADLEPTKEMVDNLELNIVTPSRGDTPDSEEAAGTRVREDMEPGDFTDQSLLQDASREMGPASLEGGIGDEDVSEGEDVYVPPMDPVVDADNRVVGGFSLSSMDSVDVERSSDGTLGDEAIAETIRRELNEDSATHGLAIEVTVNSGAVRLRGRVADLDDAQNAEEVARRVPGVVEVSEELDVAGNPPTPLR